MVIMASSEPQSELENTAVGEQSSSLSTTFDTTSSSRLNSTRLELERRQLLHTIQLLKLELSQKQLVMDSLKTEQASRVEELQEQLSDADCEKKLLEHRLRALTQVHEEEVRHLQQQMVELPHVGTQACSNHEAAPLVIDEEVRSTLQLPLVSEEEYEGLQSRGLSGMSLQDFTKVRVYEMVSPFMTEARALQAKLLHMSSQLEEEEKEKRACMDRLREEEGKANRFQQQCAELRSEVETLSSLTQQSNFKMVHYDTLKSERDGMERELDAVRRTLLEKEVRQGILTDERDRLRNELSAVEQKVALLQQDKEYLTHQLAEQGQHLLTAQERAGHLQEMLDEARRSKETLYHQFTRSREELKSEYDSQLQQELEALRQRTHLEIEQLKMHTREVYERENRSLREARDGACAERDRVLAGHKELEEKHERLLAEFRKLQMDTSETVSDLQAALKMKSFDCDRYQLLHQETMKNLQHCQLEREKSYKKAELVSQELQAMDKERMAQVRFLEERVRELSQRVDGYESLEKELDDVVLQAAEMESGPDAERVLLSYGFGTTIPSSSRRRMQQSVQLARRVLKLERINSSLRQQLKAGECVAREKERKLESLSEQLDLSKQPYKYLIESLKTRDEELEAARKERAALEEKVKGLEEQRKKLMEVKDQLASDLERLLNHREEMSIMKQLMVGIQGHMTVAPPPQPIPVATDPYLSNPHPTIFTKKEPPSSWYTRLKQRNGHTPP